MAENSTDFIPCMLIPLQDHYLLLPNSTIAEVVPMPQLNEELNKPSYWLGKCHWHDRELPVIDLESLIENKTSHIPDASKLCVLHGINISANVPVYALPCCGVPQLIYLNESALQLADDTLDSSFLHFQMKIGNKMAYIPNLDTVESILRQEH